MKKAFTLIELMAVIAILAIILAIAVPYMISNINDSKKNTFTLSVTEVQKEIEEKILTDNLIGLNNGVYNCSSYVDIDSTMFSTCTFTYQDGKITVTARSTEEFGDNIVVGGETPQLPAIKANFAAYTWLEIYALVHAVTIEELTFEDLEDTYNLAVGQEKTIDLGTLGEHTVRIANMSNGESNTCGTTGFSETACGFVVEFKDIIVKRNMNPSGTYSGNNTYYKDQYFSRGWNIGGWEESSMRTYVNSDIYNVIVTQIGNIIADTTVISGHGDGVNDNSNYTTVDKIYLLSSHEVWSDIPHSVLDTAYNNTRQLDYYKDPNGDGNNSDRVTITNCWAAAKKYNSSNDYWFLRSAVYCGGGCDIDFWGVMDSGYDDTEAHAYSAWWGVSPAFRIE